MTTPSDLQDDLCPGAAARRERPRSTLTGRRAVAGHAVEVLAESKVRMSRRAWSGGTGKHGGPQTGSAAVLAHVTMPPLRPIPKPGQGAPSVVIMTGSAAAPACVLLRGEWLRRFRSVSSAVAWCDREGWTVENRAQLAAGPATECEPC